MPLCEAVPVHERHDLVVVTNKPLIIFLKNTVRHCIAETVDQCIQALFCGFGLITTVKDGQGVFINLSNFVAVEINLSRHLFIVEMHDSGVVFLPVAVTVDGGDHLGFDLTHERQSSELL